MMTETHRLKGKIKFYDKEKNFGFITGEDGQDYFFRQSENTEKTQQWLANATVSFVGSRNHKGLMAKNIAVETQRIRGIVRFFDRRRNYGFILGEDGEEYYFDNIGRKYELETIWQESRVSFFANTTAKGKRADDILEIESPTKEILLHYRPKIKQQMHMCKISIIPLCIVFVHYILSFGLTDDFFIRVNDYGLGISRMGYLAFSFVMVAMSILFSLRSFAHLILITKTRDEVLRKKFGYNLHLFQNDASMSNIDLSESSSDKFLSSAYSNMSSNIYYNN